MANLSTSINTEAFIAYGIGDIVGATSSLKTAQTSLTNYQLEGVVQPSGSIYQSLVGTVGSAAFVHEFTYLKQAEYYYNFATDGGATGNITLRGPVLPATAVICGGRYYVTSAVLGGGSAEFSIGTAASVSTTNLVASAVLGTNGTAGKHAIIPVMTSATDIALTINSSPVMAVSVAALTAGSYKLVLWYFTQEVDATSVA